MSEQPDYSPFPRPWTAETMTQLADYAEAGPTLSAMERDLVEVVRLAALRSAQGVGWQPKDGCPRNEPVLVALIKDGKVWRVSDAKHNGLGFYTINGGVACHWATHFLPLPPTQEPKP